MSAIEVTEMYPRCRRRNATCDEDYNASLDEIRALLREGWYVGIYVDGWTEPWGCWIDDNAQLRAVCPTSPTRISPKVYPGCVSDEWVQDGGESLEDDAGCDEEPKP